MRGARGATPNRASHHPHRELTVASGTLGRHASLPGSFRFKPSGDQPKAIAELARASRGGGFQTLLGITGSGKSATIAWTIEGPSPPWCWPPTGAGQLANEFRSSSPTTGSVLRLLLRLLPARGVHPPDRHLHRKGRHDQRRGRLRHSATSALLVRRDVIIVASVSAIYGLGSPSSTRASCCGWSGRQYPMGRHPPPRRHQYGATGEPHPGKFESRRHLGGVPSYGETIVRVSSGATRWSGSCAWTITGEVLETLECSSSASLRHRTGRVLGPSPASKGAGGAAGRAGGEGSCSSPAAADAHQHDLEMMREVGFCSGIENYSAISTAGPGEAPYAPRLLP